MKQKIDEVRTLAIKLFEDFKEQLNRIVAESDAPVRDSWNRCDRCGRIIALSDFSAGKGVNRCVTPDSAFSGEERDLLCAKCVQIEGKAKSV